MLSNSKHGKLGLEKNAISFSTEKVFMDSPIFTNQNVSKVAKVVADIIRERAAKGELSVSDKIGAKTIQKHLHEIGVENFIPNSEMVSGLFLKNVAIYLQEKYSDCGYYVYPHANEDDIFCLEVYSQEVKFFNVVKRDEYDFRKKAIECLRSGLNHHVGRSKMEAILNELLEEENFKNEVMIAK